MCRPTRAEIALQMGGRLRYSKRFVMTVSKCLRSFDKAFASKSLLSYLKMLLRVGLGNNTWRQNSSSFVGDIFSSFWWLANSSSIDLRARSLRDLGSLPIYLSPSTHLMCSYRRLTSIFRFRDGIWLCSFWLTSETQATDCLMRFNKSGMWSGGTILGEELSPSKNRLMEVETWETDFWGDLEDRTSHDSLIGDVWEPGEPGSWNSRGDCGGDGSQRRARSVEKAEKIQGKTSQW